MKPPSRRSVASLVDSVQSDDSDCESAQAELLRRCEPTIRNVSQLTCPVPALREDADQSARLGFLIALRRFDPARGVKLETYAWHYMVKQIQRDVLVRHHDKFVATAPDVLAESLGGTAADPRLDVEQVHFRAQTIQVMESLPLEDVELLRRAYVHDVPQRTIAETLGVSTMTVNRALSRIRANAQRVALAA